MRPAPIASRRALPADADRDRVARGARLRRDRATTSPRARSRTCGWPTTGSTADVSELLLQYGDHRGLAAPARADRRRRGRRSTADDVIVTAGAAAALFVVATALLGAGEHALIASPNYATNLETPRALGADVEPVELRFEDGWELDLDRIEAMLRPETRLVSLTYPHNPTGAMIDRTTLRAAGRDRRASRRAPGCSSTRPTASSPTASRCRWPPSLSPRAISVSSMSKTYGLPGLRIGWLACRDPELGETLLAAKEQILICGSAIDEEMAAPGARPSASGSCRRSARRSRATSRSSAGGSRARTAFEWVEPRRRGGLLPALPRRLSSTSTASTTRCSREHGTYVGAGHWFGEDRAFVSGRVRLARDGRARARARRAAGRRRGRRLGSLRDEASPQPKLGLALSCRGRR